MISATIISDSLSPTNTRLTTMELTLHRYILGELNTHRDFTRNGASSRARSTKKTIEEVKSNPAYPPTFPKEQLGMSGTEPVGNLKDAETEWQDAANSAVFHATNLANLNVHKSVVNRILEPFMWHTAVVTSTEWDNFFNQRLALRKDGKTLESDPAMYMLASKMKDALNNSKPKIVNYGNWHLPYVTKEERTAFGTDLETLKKLSVARCAGVSYLNQNANRSHDRDLELYSKLVSADPPHWSPFEHVACPSVLNKKYFNLHGWTSCRYLMS